jgi:short-subunit dehydrogenase
MKDEHLYIVITGSSKGLGKEMAIQCAKRHMNLILTALPGESLEGFCQELTIKYHIKVQFYEIDLTIIESIYLFHDWIHNNFRVNGLINNAGIGDSGPFCECSTKKIDSIILLNIRALSILIRLLEPELMSHSKAYILNIASMAAYSPIPYKTIYPASKAYVNNFSKCLRLEYSRTGINVCVVNPGPMTTNEAVITRIESNGFWARIAIVPTEYVAEQSIKAMLNGQGVVVPGFFNKFNLLLIRILPDFIRCAILNAIFKPQKLLQQEYQIKN